VISTVTLYDNDDKILDHRSYSNHFEMRSIIDQWEKDYPSGGYYQAKPKLSNDLEIDDILTKRGKILLTSLNI
jgi:hypothetical protein